MHLRGKRTIAAMAAAALIVLLPATADAKKKAVKITKVKSTVTVKNAGTAAGKFTLGVKLAARVEGLLAVGREGVGEEGHDQADRVEERGRRRQGEGGAGHDRQVEAVEVDQRRAEVRREVGRAVGQDGAADGVVHDEAVGRQRPAGRRDDAGRRQHNAGRRHHAARAADTTPPGGDGRRLRELVRVRAVHRHDARSPRSCRRDLKAAAAPRTRRWRS